MPWWKPYPTASRWQCACHVAAWILTVIALLLLFVVIPLQAH